jgi:NAD(P)-dependent dehydrogenase (short-subunit alcohol dehydrogenase family)
VAVEVAGKVAVVTGGSSGIGLATTRRLFERGAQVLVADLQPPPPELDVHYVSVDVGDPDGWRFVIAEAGEVYGGVDIAHLNAGVTTGEASITALTDEQYRRIMRVNVDAVVFGTRALVPVIAGRGGGAIVVTASLAGLIAFPLDPIYDLTKHAMVGFVRSLAPNLQGHRITMNAVCPGIVATPLVGEEAVKNLEAAGFPLIAPEAIADAVLACVEGEGTGQCIVVQAGRPPIPFEFRNPPGPANHERPPGM